MKASTIFVSIKRCLILLCICVLILNTIGCNNSNNNSSPRPKESTSIEKVSATIIDIDKKTWYASGHHYLVKVELEYEGLTTSKEYTMADAHRLWNTKVGDSIEVNLYTKTKGDEVISQYIN